MKCDKNAGSYRKHLEQHSSTFLDTRLPGEPWVLRIKQIRITTDVPRRIRQARDGQFLLQYWTKRRFSTTNVHRIAWEPLGKALSETSGSTRRRVVKWAARAAPTGDNMLLRRQWTNDLCPRCQQPENHDHFLSCSEGTAVWKREIQRLHLWMLQQHTSPYIANTICEQLQHWHTPQTQSPTIPPLLTEVVYRQRAIGWSEAIFGCWDRNWITLQQSHFTARELRHQGYSWLTRLIKRVWQIAWALWEHRNETLHESQTLHSRMALYSAIENQYDMGFRDFPPQLRRRIIIPFSHLVTKPIHYLEMWLQRIKAERTLLDSDPEIRRTRRQRALISLWLHHSPTESRPTTDTPSSGEHSGRPHAIPPSQAIPSRWPRDAASWALSPIAPIQQRFGVPPGVQDVEESHTTLTEAGRGS